MSAPSSRSPRAGRRAEPTSFPTREEILAFVAEHPGNAGKREIARAFGLTGAAKITLKQLLKDFANEGIVEKRRRRLTPSGILPEMFAARAVGRTGDGELLAEPDEWDEDEHGPAPAILILPDRGRQSAPAAAIGDRLLLRRADIVLPEDGALRHAARIIRVLEKRQPAVVGVVRLQPGGARIHPVDKKSRTELTVADADLKDARDGDLVSIEMLRGGKWGLPRARVREVIGSLATERAITEIALVVHGIPHSFPAAVIAEAEAAEPATLKGREDWRKLPLVTIDPPDAKDHDDAVHAEPDRDPTNPGGWIATVAIADVAHYVRPGTRLDREALLRGNSVYFPDRVVPMLPERISNDLCSLKEKVDRPALAVRMIFSTGGVKLGHSFHRIMMRSAARLAYAQAQAAIDGRPDSVTDPILAGVLRPLWEAYGALRRGREAREPLELDLPERKILLKPDGTVDRVITPERLDAHKLIEEFMIQANVCAAETLEKVGVPLLYRIHDSPSEEKARGLKDFLATLDIKLASSGGLRPAVLNHILKKVAGTPRAGLVNEVMLRSQAQAEYNPANIGHFGLNLRRYAHFTSPIRRYADLIVHRALIRGLRLGDDGLPEAVDAKLPTIGAEISAAERRAMLAERETIDRLIARWMMDHIGARFRAKISGVTKSGLFVRLDDTGADGFIPASTLGSDYYAFDDKAHALVGATTGESFRLGDTVSVKLIEAQPFAGALRFELLSEGTYVKPSGRPRGRTQPAAQRRPKTIQKGQRR